MDKVVRCHSCTQDITKKIQVYTDGKVLCEQCNWRIGEEKKHE